RRIRHRPGNEMTTTTPSEPVCVVENLGIAISGAEPLPLVKDITFTIPRGGYFALVGESGSGKSITCHSLMRLLPFKPKIDGRILVDGKDVWALSPAELIAFRRKTVGMVFQD